MRSSTTRVANPRLFAFPTPSHLQTHSSNYPYLDGKCFSQGLTVAKPGAVTDFTGIRADEKKKKKETELELIIIIIIILLCGLI